MRKRYPEQLRNLFKVTPLMSSRGWMKFQVYGILFPHPLPANPGRYAEKVKSRGVATEDTNSTTQDSGKAIEKSLQEAKNTGSGVRLFQADIPDFAPFFLCILGYVFYLSLGFHCCRAG